ncbi:MAG: hypothetical protein ACXVIV_05310 [Halobacteriota archaeon]
MIGHLSGGKTNCQTNRPGHAEGSGSLHFVALLERHLLVDLLQVGIIELKMDSCRIDVAKAQHLP